MQQLDVAMQRASSIMPQHGWPVPPECCWKMAVSQASRAATTPDFAFKDLVRWEAAAEGPTGYRA